MSITQESEVKKMLISRNCKHLRLGSPSLSHSRKQKVMIKIISPECKGKSRPIGPEVLRDETKSGF